MGGQNRSISRRLSLRQASIFLTSLSLTVTGCATSSIEDLRSASVLQLVPDLTITAEPLASVQGAHPGSFRICLGAEGDRFAFARQHGDSWSVVLDGAAGENFDKLSAHLLDILYPGFNKDCTRFTYAGLRDGLWRIVSEQKTQPGFHDAEPISILTSFSDRPASLPRSALLPKGVDIVQEGAERFVVVDGKQLKRYSVGSPGKRITDAVAGSYGYAQTSNGPFLPVYSDEARERIGYRVLEREVNVFYVIDEEEYGPYDPVRVGCNDAHIKFSPDGRHFAFQALRGRRVILNVNGVDTMSKMLLKYRIWPYAAEGIVICFPFGFLDSSRLQTYAIRNNELIRFVIHIDEEGSSRRIRPVTGRSSPGL